MQLLSKRQHSSLRAQCACFSASFGLLPALVDGGPVRWSQWNHYFQGHPLLCVRGEFIVVAATLL